MLEYAAAAWASWLSATSTSKLEKVHLEAARAITGLVRSTPVEAVLAESQLPPISTHFQTISLLKADEWAHLPRSSSNPLQRMQTAPGVERQAQHSISLSESTQSQTQVLTPTPHSCEQLYIPPRDKPPPILTFIIPVDKRMPLSHQRDLTLQTIASIAPLDFQIFTDGSV